MYIYIYIGQELEIKSYRHGHKFGRGQELKRQIDRVERGREGWRGMERGREGVRVGGRRGIENREDGYTRSAFSTSFIFSGVRVTSWSDCCQR